ncbi:radical SAM protein, partial [Corallococcus sp. AB049A]
VKDLKDVREFANTTNFDNNNRTRAYMKVQDGCNRFCTYCIIPFARGPIRSREIDDAVREARILADNGFKEIVLTGIHIGSFGMDMGDMRLIDLIENIAEIDGIKRIRLSSVEPIIITDEFMERSLKTEKLCDHFHLSLQSGSN